MLVFCVSFSSFVFFLDMMLLGSMLLWLQVDIFFTS